MVCDRSLSVGSHSGDIARGDTNRGLVREIFRVHLAQVGTVLCFSITTYAEC